MSASLPSSEELNAFWGEDRLCRWPKPLLVERGFSSEDVAYLCTVGLPRLKDWSWEILDADLPRAARPGSWITLMYDPSSVPICADLSRQGEISALEDAGAGRFANTHVRAWGACLYRYRRIAMIDRDSKGPAEVEAALRRAIRAVDAAALSRPDPYWPLILDQILEGFM